MPLRPLQMPLMSRARSVTTSVAAFAAMMMPFVPDTRTPAIPAAVPSIVIGLVIVTAPKPPGSRASISPQIAVLEMAPAKVLHGAVRLQGLASSPTPETHVRVACAWAIEAKANMKIAIAISLTVSRNLFIWSLLFLLSGMAASRTRIVPATVVPSLPIVAERYIITRNFESVLSHEKLKAICLLRCADHGPKIKVQMSAQTLFS